MQKQPDKSSTTGCGEKQHSNSATRRKPGFEKGNPYRFKSGESGNPNGRPKYRTLSESIRAFLEQPTDNRKGSPTLAEAIATAVLKKARKGDVRAFEAVANRAEGKAPQRMDLTANVVNVTQIQIELFLDGARDLADRHGVPVQLAAERMLALAPAGLRPVLEAALAEVDASRD
jgi:uncharacterized protein DUF5681